MATGGICIDVVKDAMWAGADILVVGRVITGSKNLAGSSYGSGLITLAASKDIGHAAEEFLDLLNKEEIDQFRVITDF